MNTLCILCIVIAERVRLIIANTGATRLRDDGSLGPITVSSGHFARAEQTHVNGNDVGHCEKGCEAGLNLAGEPRSLDLFVLLRSYWLSTGTNQDSDPWTYMTTSLKPEHTAKCRSGNLSVEVLNDDLDTHLVDINL